GSVAMAEELLEASLLDSVDGGSRTPKVAAAPTSDPGACNACLPPSVGRVPSPDSPVSVDADPIQMASYSARKRARVVARKKREAERAQARKALMAVWSVIEEGSKSRGSRAFLRLMRRIKSRAERAWRILLHRWYSMPWDAGTVSVVAVTAIEAADDVLVGAPRGTTDGKVLLQEVEDGGDVPDVEGVQNRSRNV
ncbi:hypothetical protein B0H10DRAFT_1969147, partial [Mycena sp. CBHHK59/15]